MVARSYIYWDGLVAAASCGGEFATLPVRFPSDEDDTETR